jgi:hypothetical protein
VAEWINIVIDNQWSGECDVLILPQEKDHMVEVGRQVFCLESRGSKEGLVKINRKSNEPMEKNVLYTNWSVNIC